MELGLQYERMSCFETLESQTVTREETVETAIPEYCPDVARIVDTVGHLCVREKHPVEDRYLVAGNVYVTVLYTSGEAAGLKSLQLSVPFSCRMEERGLQNCGQVCVTGRILMLEAKAVTPRRLYIRVLPEIIAVGYRPVTWQLCTGTAPEESIRLRCEDAALPLLTGVAEQEFIYSGEIVPDGKTPEELLYYRLCPRVTALQRVGNKLMVKGEMQMWALYRSEEALLNRYSESLVFSQVVGAEQLPEEAHLSVSAYLGEQDVHLLHTEDGNGFGITAHVSLCMQGHEEKRISYVTDLYSTFCAADPVQQVLSLPTAAVPRERTETVTLQPTVKGELLFVTAVECAPCVVTVQAERTALHASLHLKLLYQGEEGIPNTAEYSEEIVLPVAQETTSASIRCCGAAQVVDGSRIRLPLEIWEECRETCSVSCIAAVELQKEEPFQPGPSLILRRMHAEETLWDVAKAYHTDEETIRQANGDVQRGTRMLLIPRVR